ncbi:MAG TPA: 5'-3' exonuclease H3TH domain-containing protein [Solirubrobacteraceae bacterium]|nr:5'-3' exonuclease H3TH domain-containing protein [Solirubrobacteraceae bacterium]
MPAPLLVVDAPFLLYRSFFALPESIRGVDDRPVGALLGATNALLRVVADRRPRAVVVCFGAEAAAYRVELFAPYHADRPPVPDPLAWQFEQAPELFGAFNWGCQGSEDLEADDLLGSYAAAETAAGGSTLILTGDRDMYQCAGEQTTVLYLKSGTTGFETVDPAEVRRRYGIEPELVPDFIALRGDPSDSLPGAPGVGPKTAAQLLKRYGSLEDALGAVGTVERPRPAPDERPRVAQSLRENADHLRRYREIALLQLIELDRPPDAETDLTGGAEAARRLGLNALAKRLEAAGSLADL